MAYFSNGTEGMMYEERYCENCIYYSNNPDEVCPIMEAHFLYGYELCNKKEDPGKVILDLLIPMGEDHFPAQCKMFIRKKKHGFTGLN